MAARCASISGSGYPYGMAEKDVITLWNDLGVEKQPLDVDSWVSRPLTAGISLYGNRRVHKPRFRMHEFVRGLVRSHSTTPPPRDRLVSRLPHQRCDIHTR